MTKTNTSSIKGLVARTTPSRGERSANVYAKILKGQRQVQSTVQSPGQERSTNTKEGDFFFARIIDLDNLNRVRCCRMSSARAESATQI